MGRSAISIKKNKKPRALDLFCGCGGLTQGLKKARYDVIGAVDVDSLSIRTYGANHPEVETWNIDIKTLSVVTVKRALGIRKGELDLLAGCPPCQGFSSLTTLNGAYSVSDPRNDLVREFLRFVKELRPKAVMMENVPGLVEDRRFKRFLKELEGFGYKGRYKVLNAEDYGVPQRRRRLIYIAGLKKDAAFAAPSRKRKTVRDAIWGLPKVGKSGDAVHDIFEQRSQKIKDLISRIPKNGGSRSELPKRSQLECHKRCNGFRDIYGRMSWDHPAPTITGGCFNPSKGRFLHPVENRAITLREAALLQGFPKSYKFPIVKRKVAVALMIGNALPPEFIRRHAIAIRKSILDQ